MYFLFIDIISSQDEVKYPFLSCTSTALSYILETIYIGQKAKDAEVLCLRPNTLPE